MIDGGGDSHSHCRSSESDWNNRGDGSLVDMQDIQNHDGVEEEGDDGKEKKKLEEEDPCDELAVLDSFLPILENRDKDVLLVCRLGSVHPIVVPGHSDRRIHACCHSGCCLDDLERNLVDCDDSFCCSCCCLC